MLSEKEQRLLNVIEAHAVQHGIEIVTLEIAGGKKSPVIRVYIDCPQGVSFSELSAAQDWIGKLLDEIDPFPGAYTLEVSSPGIDRPLRTPSHFAAAVGCDVSVSMVDKVDDRKKFTGALLGSDGRMISVQTEQGRVELPIDRVASANVVGRIDF